MQILTNASTALTRVISCVSTRTAATTATASLATTCKGPGVSVSVGRSVTDEQSFTC